MSTQDRPRALLSWSSGKDSAWALHVLCQGGDLRIVGLLTTVNEVAARVAMHAVREALLEAQAAALGLPLLKIPLPSPCTNEEYQERMGQAVAAARADGVSVIAFGDLFLEDVRAYRERMLEGTGIVPAFPLWGRPTGALAREMTASGLRAVVTCVDPAQLDPSFAGRTFNEGFLDSLPAGVDPCGERGEFHTFAYRGPMFSHELPVRVGETVARDGFVFTDVLLDDGAGTLPP